MFHPSRNRDKSTRHRSKVEIIHRLRRFYSTGGNGENRDSGLGGCNGFPDRICPIFTRPFYWGKSSTDYADFVPQEETERTEGNRIKTGEEAGSPRRVRPNGGQRQEQELAIPVTANLRSLRYLLLKHFTSFGGQIAPAGWGTHLKSSTDYADFVLQEETERTEGNRIKTGEEAGSPRRVRPNGGQRQEQELAIPVTANLRSLRYLLLKHFASFGGQIAPAGWGTHLKSSTDYADFVLQEETERTEGNRIKTGEEAGSPRRVRPNGGQRQEQELAIPVTANLRSLRYLLLKHFTSFGGQIAPAGWGTHLKSSTDYADLLHPNCPGCASR